MKRRSRRRGFTLLEVVLAMGLSFFLLAALYQSMVLQARFSEIAAKEVQEPLAARAILHQIAEELRAALVPPPVPDGALVPPASRANALLQFDPATPAGEEGSSLTERRELASSFGLERFALLGAPNRLVFLYRAPLPEEEGASELDLGTPPPDPLRQARPESALRQVFYLPRPVRRQDDQEDLDAGTESESIGPKFDGLLRQVVVNPFAMDALIEAKEQLREHLATKDEEAGSDAPAPTPPPGVLAGNEPSKPNVETKVLAPGLRAIRFRYHDGAFWRTTWDRTDAIPVAVEISIGFEDAAAEAPFGEVPLESTEPPRSEEPFAESVLGSRDETAGLPAPYRLVVHLAAAGRAKPPLASPLASPLGPPPEAGP